jgi:hypothetical protein
MSIEHKDITDPNIHPPTGFSTASQCQVLTKGPLGEPQWVFPGGNVFAQMDIINNATAVSLSAATDPTLATNSDYVPAKGAGFPWAATNERLLQVIDDEFVVQHRGLYKLDFWATLRVATNNRFIGIKFSINGVLSPQKIITRSTENNDNRNVAASAIVPVTLEVGDTIGLHVAAFDATSVTFVDAGMTMVLLRNLPV